MRSVVLRAGDFFGSGTGSWIDQAIAKDLPRGRITWPGPLDVATPWAYLPDLARTLVRVAQERHRLAAFECLHFAGHHVTAQQPMSTSTKAFGDVVEPMLAEGKSFVCMSRFASDPEWTRVYPQLAYVTLRLAGMACFYFGASYGLSTVREDHAGFYRRIYYSEQIGEARPYPGVVNRVVLFRTNAYANEARYYERFPFFRSTPMERRMLFAPPAAGELAPLTVLPTAKYYREAA